MKIIILTPILLITFRLFALSQCIPTVTNSGSTDDYIKNFSLGTNVKQNLNDYICDYNFDTLTWAYSAGSTYPFTIQTGSGTLAQDIYVWADWNADGDFNDAGESVFNSGSPIVSATILSGNITIPAIPNGFFTLRLASTRSGSASVDPCQIIGFGQFQDIRISVGSQPSCFGTPLAGTSHIQCCQNGSLLEITGFLNGSSYQKDLFYSWHKSDLTPGGPWYPLPGSSSPVLRHSTSSTTGCFRCIITCANNGLTDTSSVSCIPCSSFPSQIEPVKKDHIILFPNPSNSYISITGNANWKDDIIVEIYDFTGRKVNNAILDRKDGSTTFTLNVSALPKGQYFIRCFDRCDVSISKFQKD